MEWSQSLETRIDLIDTQHKEIIRRINDVLIAGDKTKNPKYLKLALKLLWDYCATHFSQEENLQLRSKYPQYKEHKRLHTEFLDKVKYFEHKIGNDEASIKNLSAEINKSVGEWLVIHIDGVDKKLAKYLFEKNILK